MSRLTFSAATMMAGVLFAATACTGPDASDAPTAAPETQTAVEFASPTSAPSVSTPSASTPSVVDGMNIKGPANNGKGDYLQTTIADDHSDMSYRLAVIDLTIATQYSPVEIASANMSVVQFIAEEGIDSILNDGDDVERWWTENQDNFAPEYQTTVKALLDTGGEPVNRRSWGAGNPHGFTYDYNADKPRISDRKITTTNISSAGDKDNSILVRADIRYSTKLRTAEGFTKPAVVSGFLQYAVRQNAVTGEWLITGHQSNYEAHLSRP